MLCCNSPTHAPQSVSCRSPSHRWCCKGGKGDRERYPKDPGGIPQQSLSWWIQYARPYTKESGGTRPAISHRSAGVAGVIASFTGRPQLFRRVYSGGASIVKLAREFWKYLSKMLTTPSADRCLSFLSLCNPSVRDGVLKCPRGFGGLRNNRSDQVRCLHAACPRHGTPVALNRASPKLPAGRSFFPHNLPQTRQPTAPRIPGVWTFNLVAADPLERGRHIAVLRFFQPLKSDR